MRNTRDTDGTRIFNRVEWLSKLQIQGFFLRLSQRKQSDGKETSSDDAEPEELAEEYSSLTDLTDEQMLEKASVAVQFEIGVKHTVMPTTFAKWHLKTNFHFSRLRCSRKCVSILKSHPTSRDTKSSLTKKLSQMVEDCSFMKE